MVKPRTAGTNETEMDTLKEALTTLTAYGAVAAEPTQEDLEKYGLADRPRGWSLPPRATITP